LVLLKCGELLKIFDIHPITIKLVKGGHPWILKDRYTESFPRKEEFLEVYHSPKKVFLGHFIHDPDHPRIKARLWSLEKKRNSFNDELKEKLKTSFQKRKEINFKRDNYYLVFGESDSLPGLFIQKLKNKILIHYNAFFWKKKISQVIKICEDLEVENGEIEFWEQMRIPGENKKHPVFVKSTQGKERINDSIICENGIELQLEFDDTHDIGIYTDMAAIRESIIPFFKGKKEILNLFSYTGSFSLMGLKNNSNVTSVDLSKKYMSWLERNIECNSFDETHHTSLVKNCEKALAQFQKNKQLFDLIICDPPSFSSDGKKKKSSQDFYRDNLEKMAELLSPGGVILAFLNTHKVTRAQFNKLIMTSLKKQNLIIDKEKLGLKMDCPQIPGFPEGDYLKGIILKNK
jgi:23S rRNA (cytosine1962-C5)-methyltransferase